MNEQLLEMIKKPTLWQRCTQPFWDDEHISKGMLAAHLDGTFDAASRRTEVIEKSVRWLTSLIPANSKLLDLGCGPGLYTKRFTALSYEVTGMDYSKRSIAYAKEQDGKTTYIYQDYLTMDYKEEFDAVTLIYCDYAALTAPERKVLLKKVYQALKPGGLFIFDVFTEEHFKQKANRFSWEYCESGGFWSSQPHLCIEATYLYENNTVSADQYVIVTKDDTKEYITWDSAYTKESLSAEIAPAGFVTEGVYGDVCGAEYQQTSETICLVARKN